MHVLGRIWSYLPVSRVAPYLYIQYEASPIRITETKHQESNSPLAINIAAKTNIYNVWDASELYKVY